MNRRALLALLLLGGGALLAWAVLGRRASASTAAAPAVGGPMPNAWASAPAAGYGDSSPFWDWLNQPDQVPAVTAPASSVSGGGGAAIRAASTTTTTTAPARSPTSRTLTA